MASAGTAFRVGQRMVLLLAAVLAAFCVSVLSAVAAPAVTPSPRDAEPAIDAPGMHATTPPGPASRPVAIPTLLRTSSPAELVPFGTLPHTVPLTVLLRWELRHHALPSAPYPAVRPAEGDRAPPAGNRVS